jgi:hypothetical protein
MQRISSKYTIHIANRIVWKNKYRDMYRDRKKWQCTALIFSTFTFEAILICFEKIQQFALTDWMTELN